ncbi:MAG: hypothetical protein ACLR0U_01665 [Enterocloster clostridioformis]
MCQGRDKLEYYLADYKKRADTLSKKEQDTPEGYGVLSRKCMQGALTLPPLTSTGPRRGISKS